MSFLETILGEILRVFKEEGIEASSQDELIRRLDIRPSTYQELFRDKEDMVRQVILYNFREQEKQDKRMLEQAANPVEEIILVLRHGIKELQEINPRYITDLQQYYPNVWQLVMEHLGTYNYHLDLDIINRGILQGYFRKDINLQLVIKIIMEQFNMLINPNIFPPERYELSEVFRSMYLYYVRGLCTEQGSKLADSYFAKSNI